jgi:hypothetical protein
MSNDKGEDRQMAADITDDESKLAHREWVAQLSDKEFNEWQKNQAGFATRHFEHLEDTIDETIEQIRKEST